MTTEALSSSEANSKPNPQPPSSLCLVTYVGLGLDGLNLGAIIGEIVQSENTP